MCAPSAHAIGSPSGYMPHPLMRLVLPPGICPVRSHDWFSLRVYAPSAHAIGSPSGYMPRPLTRLVLPAGGGGDGAGGVHLPSQDQQTGEEGRQAATTPQPAPRGGPGDYRAPGELLRPIGPS
eukprot:8289369-Pyramimonas_sp.AAC.1